MKKTLLILSFFILSFFHFSSAQSPKIEWQKCLGGGDNDWANAIKQTKDGGYIVAGTTMSNNTGNVTGFHGDRDYWVVKLDSLGNLQWEKALGGSSIDVANDIIETAKGDYIVAGTSGSYDGDVIGNHGTDFWIVKLNTSGIIVWQKCYGGTQGDGASSIKESKDGGFIITGSARSNDGDATFNYGGADYWIVKIDSVGVLQWQKSYGGTGDEYAQSLSQTTDGGYIVAGYSNSNDGDATGNHGQDDYWVIKIDSIGNLEWEKSLGGGDDDLATSIQQTNDGGYIVAGLSVSNNGDVSGHHGSIYPDYWIVKLDSTGGIQWENSLGGTLGDAATFVIQTKNSEYLIAGFSNSIDGDITGNIGKDDYWVVKLGSNGNIQWQKSLGGIGGEGAYSTQQTIDGGYIVAGSSNSFEGDVTNPHGKDDFWIVKLAPDPNGIVNINNPSAFEIFPNPVTFGFISINTKNKFQKANCTISDIYGRVIFEINIPQYNSEEIKIDVSAFLPGIYFICFQSQTENYISKLIVQH